MEAVLNELVSAEDLLKFERKFQSEKAAGSVSKSTQFEYAWCLVRSKYNDDIRKGLALLEELLPKGSKEEQRDYVFYLAVGNYRLKEYEKALKYVRGLLQTEPQNNQAKELERLMDKAMKKDGLVGQAIVGGMALGVAGLAGLIGLAVSKSNPEADCISASAQGYVGARGRHWKRGPPVLPVPFFSCTLSLSPGPSASFPLRPVL
ncbi:LOW QUALITY PROTEIN: mitochondrial fission 1 protein [Camelus ferus]|uniref:Mitochondrial fission 1 protein n=1 Tax=Camelus ferus TaxID=419612 RepID=A0A8B6YBY3_CAMFR|nr:LOW QUALITY PROTEIN: mitochondrial fission 1 protein [Camelus ferus]